SQVFASRGEDPPGGGKTLGRGRVHRCRARRLPGVCPRPAPERLGMSFVHLHCHTEGSLLDGMCRVRQMGGAAAEVEMPAVAITDHGVMYNVVPFYQEAREAGVKPIIGCEVYVAPRSRFERGPRQENYYHMLLLAKDRTGYHNLVQLVSKGF